MTPIEGKLILIGADIASDVLMDLYLRMQKDGQETITAEEILAEANKWHKLKDTEMQKVRDRIAGRA